MAAHWIFLLGLPLSFYHLDFFQAISTHFGKFLGTENVVINRTKAIREMICVSISVLEEPIKGFGLRTKQKYVCWQEVTYEKLGFYYKTCFKQRHTDVVCRATEKRMNKKKVEEMKEKTKKRTVMMVWPRK